MANFNPIIPHPFSLFIIFILSLIFTSIPMSTPTPTPTPTCSNSDCTQHLGSKKLQPKTLRRSFIKIQSSITQNAFDDLPRTPNGSVSVTDFNGFIQSYFNVAGEDLVHTEPVDFVPEPEGFLPEVVNWEVRAWALEVHSLWKNLRRKVSDRVLERPEFHTLLPLTKPVIIPGSRFREVNYWDSYWVIRGLLASKMYETAKGIVTNLISLIDEFGHVLNGARAYYTNRSQPPLLSAMVYDIYTRTGDIDFARKSLPALLKEHKFWNSEIHSVIIHDAEGCNRTLSRYYAMWNKPRNIETASKLMNDSAKQHLYRELASTAESGWDFSTRWMRNGSDLTTLATTSIIPVDLNAFILKMELDIVFLANVTGDCTISVHFQEAAQARKQAMNSVFGMQRWGNGLIIGLAMDLHARVTHGRPQTRIGIYLPQTSFLCGLSCLTQYCTLVEQVMQSLQSSGLIRAVGIATSLTNSGQQWDFPNGWAPLQHMIVEGLARSGSKEARSMAEDIAVRWIRTNYVAYKKSGAMHEKYDVEKCGEFGGGGEYIPQRLWVVEWSCIGILGGVRMATRPEDRLQLSKGIEDNSFGHTYY
ncbi:unnamed protein product [Camellia sinensis]